MTYLFTIYDFSRTITKINLLKKMGCFFLHHGEVKSQKTFNKGD